METIARDPCVTFAELPEPHARPYKHDAPGLQICLRHTRARASTQHWFANRHLPQNTNPQRTPCAEKPMPMQVRCSVSVMQILRRSDEHTRKSNAGGS